MKQKQHPILVRCHPIDKDSRVAVAMHHSLDAEEPLWLMIPLDAELAEKIDEVIVVTERGESVSFEILDSLAPQV